MRACKRCKTNEAIKGSLNCEKCNERNRKHTVKLIAESKAKNLYGAALQQALSMFVVSNRVYWVFRKFKRLETMDTSPETWLIDVDFAIHFVEPFKSRKEAQKAVDFAKQLQPWQEFVILHGC